MDNWSNEKPEKTRVLPPLKDLKGEYQLYVTGFTSDLTCLHDTPLYRLKKLDAIVNVDTRGYKRGIGCKVFMIEPKRFDLIGKVMSGFPGLPTALNTTEAHFFLRCNPWISLVLYGNVYKENTHINLRKRK